MSRSLKGPVAVIAFVAAAAGCNSQIFHKKSGPLVSKEKGTLPPDDQSYNERQEKLDTMTYTIDPPPGEYGFAPLVTVRSSRNDGIGTEYIQARGPHERNFVIGSATEVKALVRESGTFEYQSVVIHLGKTQKGPMQSGEYVINMVTPVPYYTVTEDDGKTEAEPVGGRELKTICTKDDAGVWSIGIVTALNELFEGDRFAQVEMRLVNPAAGVPIVVGKEADAYVGLSFHEKSVVYKIGDPLTYSTRKGSSPANLEAGACEINFETLAYNGLTRGTFSCKKLPQDEPQKRSATSTVDGVGTDIADTVLDSLGAGNAVETDPVFLPLGPVGTFGFEFQCDAYQDF